MALNVTRDVPRSFFVLLYLGVPFSLSFRPYTTMLYLRSGVTRWLLGNSSTDSLIGSEGG